MRNYGEAAQRPLFIELFSWFGSKYQLFMLLLHWSTTWNVGTYWCEVIFSWFIDLSKKAINSPWPLKVSLKKEGKRANIAKDVKKWLAFLYLRGFSCGNNKHGLDSGFVEHRGGYFIRFEQFPSPKSGDLTEKKKKQKTKNEHAKKS